MLLAARPSRRSVMLVLAIWLALLAAAGGALAVFHANSLRLIRHIELVRTSSLQRAEALRIEAGRALVRLQEKAAKANTGKADQQFLPAEDNDYLETVRLAEKSLAIDPRAPFSPAKRPLYEMLAEAHETVGAAGPADLAWSSAALADGDLSTAHTYAVRAKGRPETAAAGLMLVAETMLADKKGEEALALLDTMESTATAESRAQSEFFRARVALAQDQMTTAIDHMRRALEADPANLIVRKELGGILAQNDNPGEGADVLKAGLEQGASDDGNYLHVYGIVLNKAGRATEAVGVLKRAVELEPNSGDVRWELARAYQLSGQAGRASSTLRDAIKLKPELQRRLLE